MPQKSLHFTQKISAYAFVLTQQKNCLITIYKDLRQKQKQKIVLSTFVSSILMDVLEMSWEYGIENPGSQNIYPNIF